ncbi:LysR family transcriptional regulator [Shewanella sp. Isolate13]|uniref:LysR family transcriptional regulator n=1 Tax=Shewanella sp. Isolate13 TaxID=2908531 RepID=UPI001EFDFCE5|nr:LysR family transcriptional regulator [Shewanella sp. Isolate13]MCG9728306.1 LysR family transcriptional regulator [Shewanella sp. Isolate13]
MRHLKAFYTFHVAASSSSYSDAAKKLHITHGAVSKQIKVLETHLAMPLFYKQGRNVYLTKEGQQLLQVTQQTFDTLSSGVKRVQQLNQHYLEVSCEPTLTMRWLMPRLSAFNEQSGVDVRLSTAGGPVTLGTSGLSMAIRRDDFIIPEDYLKLPLVEEWVGPVMSPEYWLALEKDLSKLKLLHSQTRPKAWQNWLKTVTEQSVEINDEQTFAHFYFCFQAAVDGLGAALGSYPLVVDDLKRGNLVAPFGFVPSEHQYVAITAPYSTNAELAAFSLWLTEQLAICIPSKVELGKATVPKLTDAIIT